MGRILLTLMILSAISSYAQAPMPASADIEKRVDSILRQMTTEEKVDMLGGVHTFDVRGYERLGLPMLETADGPYGVRNDGRATVMAGGIGLAATWNPELATQVGTELGRDARAKGKHFLLAPGVNIYRSPLNGRNFEYFGEDPFLASRMGVGYIKGVQSQGVCATVKHFLGNNSEFARHTSDSVIDERTLREIYLPAFEAAVKEADVGAVMDSYNLTNGLHMSQNGRFNIDLVKKEWQFPGIIMSDWGGTYDALGAANGGLDLEMPSGKYMNRENLLPALKEGEVTQETIDDKVRRILRTEVRFGWLDRKQLDPATPRYNQQARQVALEAAREGMVLLKNDGDLLPLSKDRIKSIAVIGPDAYPAVPVGGGSAQVSAFQAKDFMTGLSDYLGDRARVLYAAGLPTLGRAVQDTKFSTAEENGEPGLKVETFDNTDVSGTPTTSVERHLTLGRPLDLPALSNGEADFDFDAPRFKDSSTRWTGYYKPATAGTYDIFVQTGGFGRTGYRVYVDGNLVFDNWKMITAVVEQKSLTLTASSHKVVLEQFSQSVFGGPFIRMGIVRQGTWVAEGAEQIAAGADVVVLAVGFEPSTETEGMDRTFHLPPGQDELIQKIAAANKNVIIALTSGGNVDMTLWIDRVSAIIEAWYPGQEGGTALAEILFGDVNPSGRLPASFERRWEDNPTHENYYTEAGTNRVVYKEGVMVGYRGYEMAGTKPLFPFGYGLSYTTFKFGNLTVKPAAANTASSPKYDVSFDVTNIGKRAGAEVGQVYISDKHASVPRPPKELKGFAKVNLRPGETKRVTVPLDVRSLAYYDVAGKQWRADPGTFNVLVGSSSDKIELTGNLTLSAAAFAK